AVLEGRLAVCRLAAAAPWPPPGKGPLFSITRTADELSVVCASEDAPAGARVEDGWRAFRIEGPIPFAEIGVMAGLSGALARAGVSVFAVSTFDTDYVLVKDADLARARVAVRDAGYALSD
ncbi:MAG TPA: ACT domain-containing protein, partial [Vicinamibacteria bacterium]|nr:ACT domain-containing protein [Vicinamibacteria bacterium]